MTRPDWTTWSPRKLARFFDASLTADDFPPRDLETAAIERMARRTPARKAAFEAYHALLDARGWPRVDQADFDDAWAEAVRVRGEWERGAA